MCHLHRLIIGLLTLLPFSGRAASATPPASHVNPQTTVRYVSETVYRTVWTATPVARWQPVQVYDAFTGLWVTQYQCVAQQVWQQRQVAETRLRPVIETQHVETRQVPKQLPAAQTTGIYLFSLDKANNTKGVDRLQEVTIASDGTLRLKAVP